MDGNEDGNRLPIDKQIYGHNLNVGALLVGSEWEGERWSEKANQPQKVGDQNRNHEVKDLAKNRKQGLKELTEYGY